MLRLLHFSHTALISVVALVLVRSLAQMPLPTQTGHRKRISMCNEPLVVIPPLKSKESNQKVIPACLFGNRRQTARK